MSSNQRFGRATAPPRLWAVFEQIRADPLVRSGSKNEIALGNLALLSKLDLDGDCYGARDIERFIDAVFQTWVEPLSREPDGWTMYAWYDGQAGQLRLSACPAREVADLPFGCALQPATAAEVATRFMDGDSAIAWSSLQIVEPGAPLAPEPERRYVLEVYTQRVSRSFQRE